MLKQFVFLVLFASVANALSLNLEADSASIYGTHGSLFVWVTNDGPAKDLSFSAQTGDLTAYFEDSHAFLAGNGAKGTRVHFSAPDCSRGVQDVLIQAQVSNASGSQTLEKRLRVFVYPRASCDYAIYLNRSADAFVPADATGDGSLVQSHIALASYFDPTGYDVQLSAPSSCKSVRQGDFVRQRVWVSNAGAAGTFELRLVSASADALNAGLSKSWVSLERGESAEVFVESTPSQSAHGTHYLGVQALKDGLVFDQQDVCLELEDYQSAFMLLPKAIDATDCKPVSFQGVLFNNGTADGVFSVSSSKGRVDVPAFSLGRGSSFGFRVTILPGELKAGDNVVVVGAISTETNSPIAGGAGVLVRVTPCVLPTANAVVQQSEQTDELLKYTVTIQNDFDYDLQNVSVSITGIPTAWEVTGDSGIVVPAKSARNATVWLKQTTQDEASSAAVVIKNNGETVAIQPIGRIKPQGTSLTGYLTLALSQNGLFIGLLVIVALLIVILASRRKTDEEKYRERVHELQKAVHDKE